MKLSKVKNQFSIWNFAPLPDAAQTSSVCRIVGGLHDNWWGVTCFSEKLSVVR